MSEIVQTPAWQRLPLGPKYSSWHTTIKMMFEDTVTCNTLRFSRICDLSWMILDGIIC